LSQTAQRVTVNFVSPTFQSSTTVLPLVMIETGDTPSPQAPWLAR
jgi:hypothetical protein